MSFDELLETPAAASPGWTLLGSDDTSAIAYAPTAVAGGRIYGLNGDPQRTVVSSGDGSNWSASGNLPYRVGSAACAHNGALFVSGGAYAQETNDVFQSTEGVNWTQSQAPWAPRYGHCMVSFQGRMLLFGGRTNNGQFFTDLWVYDAGSWHAGGQVPFGIINCAAAAFGNVLCVVGGPEGAARWFDGANWTADVPPWAPGSRTNPGIAVLGSRLYVVGGSSGTRSAKELWSCAGSGSWRPEATPPWTTDLNAPCVGALNGAMLVFGGALAMGPASKSVYQFTPG